MATQKNNRVPPTKTHLEALSKISVIRLRDVQNYDECQGAEITHETAAAVLVRYQEREVWIPKSLVRRSTAGNHLFIAHWKMREHDFTPNTPQPIRRPHGYAR